MFKKGKNMPFYIDGLLLPSHRTFYVLNYLQIINIVVFV